jgi:ubiquinone/menaquinone biosynthesis C-methylase UbiE
MSMKIKIFRTRNITLQATACLLLLGCGNGATTSAATEEYRYTKANRDGIGKYYMGREISHVMGHQGADWLQRRGRETEERTDILLQQLPINPGDNIADIGAGSGYFSLPMAEITGSTGTVYAVDIQPEMLAIIAEKSLARDITNIQRIQASDQDPGLPANSINMALFVDAYHEFEWPREVMTAVVDSLVPGGKVVLIEYRAEDPRVNILKNHKMTETQARIEMEAVGLVFIKNDDFLPKQHFLVFKKPEPPNTN